MRRILAYLLCLICSGAIAQKKGKALCDSLITTLPAMRDDSIKVKVYNRILQTYYTLDPLKAFYFAHKGLQLAEKIHWDKGVANLNNNLGLCLSDTGNNLLARTYFLKSYSINKKLNNKINLINNLNNLGRSYQFQSEFSTAISYLFQALKVSEELKNEDKIALVCSNLANCFEAQKNYSRAEFYLEKEIKGATHAKDSSLIARALLQLGSVKLETHDTSAASHFMSQALVVAEKIEYETGVADVLSNQYRLYPHDIQLQIRILKKAGRILDQINPSSMASLDNFVNLGDSYTRLALRHSLAARTLYFDSAAILLNRARILGVKNHSPQRLGITLQQLANLEEARGNFQAAFADLKKASALNESLFSQQRKNEIASIEGKHDLALKDQEIALNKLKIVDQRKMVWLLLIGICLLVIIGTLLSRQSRSRKQTNQTLIVLNNKLDEANKIKARFFGILSHDLRHPLVSLIHFLHLQKESESLLDVTQLDHQRQKISASAEDLLGTLEFILLWSKEQMESFKPHFTLVHIADLFDIIQKSFSAYPGVAITCLKGIELYVEADENYLRTIMQNLTMNAVQALKGTPAGKIEWSAFRSGDKTLITITDNGPGIPEEKAKALFDENLEFQNSEHGFGFHMIRDLAKAIYCKISIHTIVGEGTTVTLSV